MVPAAWQELSRREETEVLMDHNPNVSSQSGRALNKF
jgi:hypothetical protein